MPIWLKELAPILIKCVLEFLFEKSIQLIFRRTTQEKNELGGEIDYSRTYQKIEGKLLKRLRKKNKTTSKVK